MKHTGKFEQLSFFFLSHLKLITKLFNTMYNYNVLVFLFYILFIRISYLLVIGIYFELCTLPTNYKPNSYNMVGSNVIVVNSIIRNGCPIYCYTLYI